MVGGSMYGPRAYQGEDRATEGVGASSKDGAGLGIARIVLACAQGVQNNEVAAKLRVSKQTVCKWRDHFVRMRLEGTPTHLVLVRRVRSLVRASVR